MLRIPWEIKKLFNRRRRDELEDEKFIYNGVSKFSLNVYIKEWISDENIQNSVNTSFGHGKNNQEIKTIERRKDIVNHLLFCMKFFQKDRNNLEEIVKKVLNVPPPSPLFTPVGKKRDSDLVYLNIVERNILLCLMDSLKKFKKIPRIVYSKISNFFLLITGVNKPVEYLINFNSINYNRKKQEKDIFIMTYFKEKFKEIYEEILFFKIELEKQIPVLQSEERAKLREKNQRRRKKKDNLVEQVNTSDHLSDIIIEAVRDDTKVERKRKFEDISYDDPEVLEYNKLKIKKYTRRKIEKNEDLLRICSIEGYNSIGEFSYSRSCLKSGEYKLKESHKSLKKSYICNKCYKRELKQRKRK